MGTAHGRANGRSLLLHGKKGAQNGAYLKLPDAEAFKTLYKNSGSLIAIADIAPELEGAIPFIQEVSKLADFIVCSSDYTQKRVFLGGKEL